MINVLFNELWIIKYLMMCYIKMCYLKMC